MKMSIGSNKFAKNSQGNILIEGLNEKKCVNMWKTDDTMKNRFYTRHNN